MGDVNFYLKKPGKNSKSSIYLFFQFKAPKPLKYYFGGSIDRGKPLKEDGFQNWSTGKQRVRSNRTTTEDGKYSLNDLLDNLEKECLRAYNAEIKNGTPLPETLKKHLDNFMDQQVRKKEQDNSKPTLFNLIDRFIAGEIKKKGGREKSKRTLDNYHATKLHLQAFEKAKGYNVNFDSITLDFFNSYTTFLKKEFKQITRGKNPKTIIGLEHNTIAKDISFLKGFMNKGVSLGLNSNLAHRHEDFSYAEEETDAVYIKEKELEHLFDFDAGNDKLNRTKDLFIAGAWLGLRYSDLKRIGELDIVQEEGEKYVRSKNQKTGKWVYIPLHPMVLKVMEKYKDNINNLPKAISAQNFNAYTKDVFRLAGFTEKGRLETDPAKPLFECVSSHTMRRSMASNFYLMGVAPEDLMPVSGHSSTKSFYKYIKVSKLDKAKKLNTRIKQLWDKRQLKAV